jgi:large subunit ribosomal protein L10
VCRNICPFPIFIAKWGTFFDKGQPNVKIKRRNTITDTKTKKVSANRLEKEKTVAEIQKYLSDAKSVIFMDYCGINVSEDTTLRNKFRPEGVVYKIYKNNLVKIALNNLGITALDDQLVGTLSVAFSMKDEISAAKIVAAENFQKKMAFKFGLIGDCAIDAVGVAKLATMPSKEQLIAQLLGLIQSGARNLATVINAVPRNLAMVVDARAKQLA